MVLCVVVFKGRRKKPYTGLGIVVRIGSGGERTEQDISKVLKMWRPFMYLVIEECHDISNTCVYLILILKVGFYHESCISSNCWL